MTEEEKPFTLADAIESVEREEYDDHYNCYVNAYERDGKLVVEMEIPKDFGDEPPVVIQRFVFTGIEEEIGE